MIGILLALQVNTWNEHRKDRIRETKILDQIHIDFLRNKVQIDSIRSSNEKALISCEKIISFLPLSKTKASLDSVTKYIQDATQIRTFNPSNGSIDALINSSSFEVIQNDTLRNLLVSWKDVYLDYREEEQNARN